MILKTIIKKDKITNFLLSLLEKGVAVIDYLSLPILDCMTKTLYSLIKLGVKYKDLK